MSNQVPRNADLKVQRVKAISTRVPMKSCVNKALPHTGCDVWSPMCLFPAPLPPPQAGAAPAYGYAPQPGYGQPMPGRCRTICAHGDEGVAAQGLAAHGAVYRPLSSPGYSQPMRHAL